ncbi:hypothetical protein [Emticicia fontis]
MEDIEDFKLFLQRREEEEELKAKLINNKIEFWNKKIDASSMSGKEKNKNKLELTDLGYFIYSYNYNLNIVDGNRERPDFILNDGVNNIGIELTELITSQQHRKFDGILKRIFREIERDLKINNPTISGVYSVDFYPYVMYQSNVKDVKNELFNLIKDKKSSGKFIKNLIVYPHNEFSIVVSSFYALNLLTKDIIFPKVLEKEKKADNYRGNGNVEKLWLLLIVSGIGEASDYSDIDNDLLTDTYDSKFDKVIIFNRFKNDYIEIKVNTLT